jgi:hypothetical protein
MDKLQFEKETVLVRHHQSTTTAYRWLHSTVERYGSLGFCFALDGTRVRGLQNGNIRKLKSSPVLGNSNWQCVALNISSGLCARGYWPTGYCRHLARSSTNPEFF